MADKKDNVINLYWPVYRNLEKELLDLSYQIHICEGQLGVYSVKCADLLFRASAEIESLIRDLYRSEKKAEPRNPGSALLVLNDSWSLEKKVVIVSAPNIYFVEERNKSFAPFSYSKGDENDYYSAYNSVKHDRVKNISKANLRVLMRAMAALYLLNIYYRDEKFTLASSKAIRSEFDNSLGSEIFAVKPSDSYLGQINMERTIGSDNKSVDSTYLSRFPQNEYEKLYKLQLETMKNIQNALTQSIEYNEFISAGGDLSECKGQALSIAQKIGLWSFRKKIKQLPREEQLEAILNSSEYKDYSKNNKVDSGKIKNDDVDALCNLFGYWTYLERTVLRFENKRIYTFMNSRIEMVLNKGQVIYTNENPTVLPGA